MLTALRYDRAIELGCRSVIATFLPGPRPLGSMWFASNSPDAYLPEDEDTVRAIAEGLHQRLGLRKQDVFITLVEVKKENWSFGNGEAQYGDRARPAVKREAEEDWGR